MTDKELAAAADARYQQLLRLEPKGLYLLARAFREAIAADCLNAAYETYRTLESLTIARTSGRVET